MTAPRPESDLADRLAAIRKLHDTPDSQHWCVTEHAFHRFGEGDACPTLLLATPADTGHTPTEAVWVDIDGRLEGGQPNGVGEIEPSDHREWFREERETHHRSVVTFYGPWVPGSVKSVGGEGWTDYDSAAAALADHPRLPAPASAPEDQGGDDRG